MVVAVVALRGQGLSDEDTCADWTKASEKDRASYVQKAVERKGGVADARYARRVYHQVASLCAIQAARGENESGRLKSTVGFAIEYVDAGQG